jgi:hypothetical protein
MMKNSELYDQLAWEQYRIRKGKKDIDQTLNKVITFDLICQARRDSAMCSNDAKICYARIVRTVASIAMQQQHVPSTACMSIFTTLQCLHHTV